MKFDIAMVVGGLDFDHTTVHTGALGGSESAGYYMAHALAKLGHHVKLFCGCKQMEQVDGVMYIPIENAQSFTGSIPTDIVIVQRDPSYFGAFQNSKCNILWNHDLALGRYEAQYKSVLWNVDKFFVLSEHHKQQYKEALSLDESVFFKTSNGIDYNFINDIQTKYGKTRNHKQLVYAARPERGLDILLSEIMPRLLEIDPEYKLIVAGYDNPKSELGEFYRQCNLMADRLGDSVERVGGLSKAELYKLFSESGCYVYPSPSPINANFTEISCISAMETQACGLPFVGSNKGALPETLHKDSCILLDGEPNSQEFIKDFVNAVDTVCRSEEKYNEQMSAAGLDNAPNLDWSYVAEEWVQCFEDIFQSKNGNAKRLVCHAEKFSDAMLAMKIANENGLHFEQAHLKEKYGFIDSEESFKAQYEQFDSTDVYTVDHMTGHVGSLRFQELFNFIKQNETEIKTVGDYGCNAGGFTSPMADLFKSIEFNGYDVNEKVLNCAIENTKQAYPEIDNVEYFNSNKLSANKKYDLMICQEVLEHVAKPWELIDKLEESLEMGGHMYITVPYGPWEHDSYTTNGPRFHLWHFEQHDINDMLKDKEELNIRAVTAGMSKKLGLPVGWWFVTYKKNGAKTYAVDMERKAKYYTPMQTVSAVLICGGVNAKNQLHWCLSSIRDVVDELIIVNCGMDDETKRIAKQYDPLIIEGVDPKTHGFDVARNLGVEKASCDWILWLDTDESVTNPSGIPKYLKNNVFEGYSIRQHHFAVDTSFPADMPVRMFRNSGEVKFYGKIHEHPEKGINEGPGEVIVLSDVNIPHTGYLTEQIRRDRFSRNLPMLNKDVSENPDRLLQKHFLIRDNMLLVSYELQQNGGQVTDSVIKRCLEVKAIYNKHLRGNKKLAHIDSLQWYTKANEILNNGVAAEVVLKINGEEVGFNGRFDSINEIENELTDILHDVGDKFERKDY